MNSNPFKGYPPLLLSAWVPLYLLMVLQRQKKHQGKISQTFCPQSWGTEAEASVWADSCTNGSQSSQTFGLELDH